MSTPGENSLRTRRSTHLKHARVRQRPSPQIPPKHLKRDKIYLISFTLETELFLCSPNSKTRRDLEGFSVSICSEAKERGWYTSASWIKNGIRIRLQNYDQLALTEILHALTRAAEKDGCT